jgi:tetratricopeptide (TPR) repeat protein
MTKEKSQKSWIDPRLIRPANWSPPKMTEKSYSRMFASVEIGQRNIYISGQLASIYGTAQQAYFCHLFYTDILSPSIFTGSYWSPWNETDQTILAVQAMLPFVDSDINEFCQNWLTLMHSLDVVNQKMAENFASIFNIEVPVNKEEFDKLRDLIEADRKLNGVYWVTLPEFSPLVSQLDNIVTRLQDLIPRLQEFLKKINEKISPDDFASLSGNQKIQTQIEICQNDPQHKRVIKKLNNLLLKNPPRIQKYQIFKEIGFRYSMIGDNMNAIDSYSKSIESGNITDPMVYYRRGEIYFDEKDWDKALKDFEKAIELEVYSPEREHALECIDYIKSI